MSFLQKIRTLKDSNKKIIENFSYLSLIQVSNIVLPLIIYPYLIRILGKELYGTIIFTQTVATYFSIFINFGFNIFGAKEIAINKQNIEKINEIFSSILIIKSIFWIISILILIISLFLLHIGVDKIILYIFSFLICINEVLFPQWFFQGIEKMKYNNKSIIYYFNSIFCTDKRAIFISSSIKWYRGYNRGIHIFIHCF